MLHQNVGFHFNVVFLGLPRSGGRADLPKSTQRTPEVSAAVQQVDIGFQSATGLDVELETEPLKEGGENRFEHVLPGRTKYSRLTLKRGILLPTQSAITDWCIRAFQDREITPLNTVHVELLNPDHEILMVWVLSHVWPVSWKVGELNAERGEVLIETFELNYNRFQLKKG